MNCIFFNKTNKKYVIKQNFYFYMFSAQVVYHNKYRIIMAKSKGSQRKIKKHEYLNIKTEI